MHGLIGHLKATPGQRDALINILLDSTQEMPGCRSYAAASQSHVVTAPVGGVGVDGSAP